MSDSRPSSADEKRTVTDQNNNWSEKLDADDKAVKVEVSKTEDKDEKEKDEVQPASFVQLFRCVICCDLPD